MFEAFGALVCVCVWGGGGEGGTKDFNFYIVILIVTEVN